MFVNIFFSQKLRYLNARCLMKWFQLIYYISSLKHNYNNVQYGFYPYPPQKYIWLKVLSGNAYMYMSWRGIQAEVLPFLWYSLSQIILAPIFGQLFSIKHTITQSWLLSTNNQWPSYKCEFCNILCLIINIFFIVLM